MRWLVVVVFGVLLGLATPVSGYADCTVPVTVSAEPGSNPEATLSPLTCPVYNPVDRPTIKPGIPVEAWILVGAAILIGGLALWIGKPRGRPPSATNK